MGERHSVISLLGTREALVADRPPRLMTGAIGLSLERSAQQLTMDNRKH
jgi:hypothetical protein